MPTPEQIEKAARAMHDGPLGADDYYFDAPENAKQRAWCIEMATAALTAAEGVKPRVKELVWFEAPYISTDDDNGPLEGRKMLLKAWAADPYLIIRQRGADGLFILRGTRNGQGLVVPTLKAAMEAAQADYELRHVRLAALQEGE